MKSAPYVPSQHWVEYTEMWRRIKSYLGVPDFAKTSWEAVYRAKRDLGYTLAPREAAYIKDSPAAPVRQSPTWDDPDR